MDAFIPQDDDTRLSIARSVDRICDEFEQAWAAGGRPRIEDYLDKLPESNRSPLLRELLATELQFRGRTDDTVSREEYLSRFPELAAVVEHVFSKAVSKQKANQATDTATDIGQGTTDPNATAIYHSGLAAVDSEGESFPRRFGDYELLEEIARGGMGVVYKARQITADRLVAVKMILSGRLASSQAIERFYTEARAAANLKHPNIVGVHEVGQINGQHFYSMEYVEGRSLDDLIREGTLFNQAIARFIRRIANAIQYAHEQGVLHRDLKPSNVLVDEQGEPQVTDFGLAKRTDAASELTSTEEVLGTPSYMPPEQARGDTKRIGKRSDVYSLGALMYALITGRPPFRAGNVTNTLLQVINAEPVLPRELNPLLPKDLETICLKCLKKEPSKRYTSAQDLADELGRYQRGEPIQARPLGRPARAWRWCKRNPVVASLITAVAVSLVLGTSIATTLAIIATQNATALAKSYQDLTGAKDEVDKKSRELSDALESKIAANTREAEQRRNAEKQEQIAKANALNAIANEKQAYVNAEKERAARQNADWRLYALQIASAKSAWGHNDAARAWHDLESCRRDFRGWEYDYLRTLFSSNQLTFRGHSNQVNCVAFSHNGKWIASGSDDKTIRIWKTTGGRAISIVLPRAGRVWAIAVSPDDQQIVIGASDGTLRLINAVSARAMRTFRGHTHGVRGVVFSPDGKRIISGSEDQTVRVWDTTTGKPLLTLVGDTGPVTAVAHSPDGKQIASASYGRTVRVWDAKTGKPLLTLEGHTGTVHTLAISPDSRRIVSGSWDQSLRLWDADTGKQLLMLAGHTGGVTSVAFSPDGQWLVSGSWDKTIRVWDAISGRQMSLLNGHTGVVSSVAVSPDGMQVASGSSDMTVKRWTARGGQNVDALILKGHHRKVSALAFSSDGKRLASVSQDSQDKTITLWDTHSGQSVMTLAGHAGFVTSVAFSPDGKWLISGGSADKLLKLWDAKTGKSLLTLSGHTGPVRAVAYSPHGERIASGSQDTTVRVWDTAGGREVLTMRGHTGSVTGVAFSPDGKRVVSCSYDKTVRVWDADSGRLIMTLAGHNKGVNAVAYSPDGEWIVDGSADKTLMLWDAASSQHLRTLEGHKSWITSVTVSPDGRRIASASGDGLVKLWDTTSGQEVLTLEDPRGEVTCVVFSSDGSQLAGGWSDGTIRIWDASPGRAKTDLPSIRTESGY